MRALLPISFLVVLSAPSNAADIIFDPEPVPPMLALPEAPFSWSGRYIGIDLGYGQSKVKQGYSTDGVPTDLFNIKEGEGAFGGIYAGFGRQARNLYFGFEGDLQYAAIKARRANPAGVEAEFTPTWLGSTRLRAGYAINSFLGQDTGHLLPYVTGGLAFGGFKATKTESGTEWTASRADTGYTLGAGIDYAINHNTIAKLEYQYMDFGNRTFSEDVDLVRLRMKAHTIRAGVAYKF